MIRLALLVLAYWCAAAFLGGVCWSLGVEAIKGRGRRIAKHRARSFELAVTDALAVAA